MSPTLPGSSRIAVVHDWLDTWRGGECVLAAVLGLFPHADLFSLIDVLPEAHRARLGGRRARTSWLQRIPGARRHFRALLPLFPRAIESLDLSAYDVVISVSHAVAKGVRTGPEQLHVCYCLTPMRYAWDLRDTYLDAVAASGWRRDVAGRILDRLRGWDARASDRVDAFIAISEHIRRRIERCYGRDAAVVHPPVDVGFFTPAPDSPASELSARPYVTAARWVPYKRIDLIVEAFRAMPGRRLVVAGDGPDAARIRRAAGPNVTFIGEPDREGMRDLLRNARAFIYAAEEDFGILPVEAQACGTPVIALARGGVLETIRAIGPGATGLLFTEQNAASIANAISRFESIPPLRAGDCRRQAERFATEHFETAFTSALSNAWARFRASRA